MRSTIDTTMIRNGADVIASDGNRIGTVDEVASSYLLVKKGLIFTHDLYIPLTAVSRLNENEVWLDVSKSEINARGWNEPIHS
jgi:hypothetical protein